MAQTHAIGGGGSAAGRRRTHSSLADIDQNRSLMAGRASRTRALVSARTVERSVWVYMLPESPDIYATDDVTQYATTFETPNLSLHELAITSCGSLRYQMLNPNPAPVS